MADLSSTLRDIANNHPELKNVLIDSANRLDQLETSLRGNGFSICKDCVGIGWTHTDKIEKKVCGTCNGFGWKNYGRG